MFEAETKLKSLSAQAAACSSVAGLDSLLTELHDIIFTHSDHQACHDAASAHKRVEALLESVKEATQPSAAKPGDSKVSKRNRPQVAEDLVTLECVLLLAHVLLSCVRGEAAAVTQRQRRRLDALMPKLFTSTKVSPGQLRDVALRLPWQLLVAHAAKAASSEEVVPGGLREFVLSLNTDFGCDFLPVLAQKNPAPGTNEAAGTASPQQADRESIGCLSWSAGVRQAQQTRCIPREQQTVTRPAGVSQTRGLPSYLLTKRKVEVTHTPREAAIANNNEPWGGGRSNESPLPSRRLPSDSEDSNSILAGETPVIRRRRLDPALYISPSPDPVHRETDPRL